MEVKKKFEKPQMEVVKLKPAGIMSGSHCPDNCYPIEPDKCSEEE
jgi:hypothetical protein